MPNVIAGQLVVTGSCALMMEQSGQVLQLTDPHKVVLNNVVFKVIPFAANDAYLQSDAECAGSDYLHCLNKP